MRHFILGLLAVLALGMSAMPASVAGGDHLLVAGLATGTYTTSNYTCAALVALSIRALPGQASLSTVLTYYDCSTNQLPHPKYVHAYAPLTGSWEAGWVHEGPDIGCFGTTSIKIGPYGTGQDVTYRQVSLHEDSISCPSFQVEASFDVIG